MVPTWALAREVLARQCSRSRLHQTVSHSREPQPQLVALKVMSRGAIAQQFQLLLFDAVFHLPSGAILFGCFAFREEP